MKNTKCNICGTEIKGTEGLDYYLTVEGDYYCEDCSGDLHRCDHCNQCTALDPETVLIEDVDYDGDTCYEEEFWCKECITMYAYKKNPNDDIWWA